MEIRRAEPGDAGELLAICRPIVLDTVISLVDPPSEDEFAGRIRRALATVGFEPIGVFREVGFKLDRWHRVPWWQRPVETYRAGRRT